MTSTSQQEDDAVAALLPELLRSYRRAVPDVLVDHPSPAGADTLGSGGGSEESDRSAASVEGVDVIAEKYPVTPDASSDEAGDALDGHGGSDSVAPRTTPEVTEGVNGVGASGKAEEDSTVVFEDPESTDATAVAVIDPSREGVVAKASPDATRGSLASLGGTQGKDGGQANESGDDGNVSTARSGEGAAFADGKEIGGAEGGRVGGGSVMNTRADGLSVDGRWESIGDDSGVTATGAPTEAVSKTDGEPVQSAPPEFPVGSIALSALLPAPSNDSETALGDGKEESNGGLVSLDAANGREKAPPIEQDDPHEQEEHAPGLSLGDEDAATAETGDKKLDLLPAEGETVAVDANNAAGEGEEGLAPPLANKPPGKISWGWALPIWPGRGKNS